MTTVNETVTYVATIEAPAGCAESIAVGLEAAESPRVLAVTLFECGHDRVEVSAHYADEPSRIRLTELIEAASLDARLGALRIEPLPQRNWVPEAERLRGPVSAGRFLVHGRHDRGKVSVGRFTLEIDASVAFGTAHHATTRGCLIALDRLAKRTHPRRVLDIGTGTGILAIAAARALNARVVASDMDPIAVAVAAEKRVEWRSAARQRDRGGRGCASSATAVLRPICCSPTFCSAPCSTLLRPSPARSAQAACACSQVCSSPKRGRSKRASSPTGSGSIRESFSMAGPPCSFGVAAGAKRERID